MAQGKKFKGWPPSFKPTASRWATVQILISTGLFFIAVFASLYAISINVEAILIPTWLVNALPIMLVISFSLGALLAVGALGFALWFICVGSQDETAETIRNLDKELRQRRIMMIRRTTQGDKPKKKPFKYRR